MMKMIVMRMANPVWLEPKGAEVEKFTGEPGLVVKYNPLTSINGAKPERIPGEGPNQSLFHDPSTAARRTSKISPGRSTC
jgi:hypothetical protein